MCVVIVLMQHVFIFHPIFISFSRTLDIAYINNVFITGSTASAAVKQRQWYKLHYIHGKCRPLLTFHLFRLKVGNKSSANTFSRVEKNVVHINGFTRARNWLFLSFSFVMNKHTHRIALFQIPNVLYIRVQNTSDSSMRCYNSACYIV